MPTKVSLARSTLAIKPNTAALTAGATKPSSTAAALRTTPAPQNYVKDLFDVEVPDDIPAGATLVWDAELHKYIVKTINVENQILDGGTF